MMTWLRVRALRWLREPSVRVASLFAVAGIGFTGGHLVLARALSRYEYGIAALWLTLFYLGGALAPWGADGLVNRRRIAPDRRFIRRTIATSTLTALIVAGIGRLAYELTPVLLTLLVVGISASGVATVAAAQFQARQRFVAAMAIWQGSNIVLLAVGAVALAQPGTDAVLPIVAFTLGAVVIATAGWWKLPGRVRARNVSRRPYPWGEALSYYFAASATAFLPQIERLVIPGVLTLEDLAEFGVLAALVLSPFRMLESGVAYTLLPRMRQAGRRRERRRLLWSELRTVALGAALAALLVWYLAPWVTRVFLGDKYSLAVPLLVAGLLAGSGKLVGAMGRSLIAALGSKTELAVYGAASWVALLAAGAGAWFGARWGLPGVIYGTMAGLSIRWLLALALSVPHLVGDERPHAGEPEGGDMESDASGVTMSAAPSDSGTRSGRSAV